MTLPALGESVTEGTVTRWLKQVGDSVEADEPLLEVSTDKVDTEVPSPVAGTLLSITAQEDDTVEVGGELGVIGSPDAAGSSGDGDGSGGGADTGADGTTAQQPSERAPERQAGSDADRAPSPAPAEPEPPAEPVRPVGTDSGGGRPTGSGASGGSGGDSGPDAATSGARSGDAGSASPYVTPLVRRLAAENEVDLTSVTGSGVGGRIRKQDVLDAAEAARRAAREAEQAQPAATAGTSGTPDGDGSGGTGSGSASRPPAPASPLRGTTEKMSRLRRVIATRMVESLQTSAQLTTVVEVDVTAVARLRQRAKAGFEEREGVKLSFLPFFALATVEALKAMPRLNATLDSERGEITYAAGEHLGIAVDTERGLLVPVVTDAGDLNLAGLARRIADLATRTRTNALSPDELAGGTFTLTNTGSRGALFDTPILNQPQVGILGTGAVVKRPVVVDAPGIGETIAVRSMVYLALTYDHRLVDGADAARFLVAIRQRLEEGAFEAEVGL